MLEARNSILLLALLAVACHRDATAPPSPATSSTARATPAGDERGLVVQNPTGDRPYFVDLGRRLYGEKPKHVFKLENTEDRAVTIEDMVPSCSCTVPRVSYTAADGTLVKGSVVRGQKVITIPPHVVADVAVEIDTTHVEKVNADKLSMVRLRSDSAGTPYITLELHIIVTRAFRAVPAIIELGETPQSVGKTGRSDVSTDKKGDLSRILTLESIEGPFTAEMHESKSGDESFWIVTASAVPGLPLGPAHGTLWLSTTSGDGAGRGQAFGIPVRAQIVPDVVLHPAALVLAGYEKGRENRLEAELVALAPKASVHVIDATFEGSGAEHLKLEFVPVSPDDSNRAQTWKLTLVADATLDLATFQGTLTIRTDDPNVPVLRVPYSGTAR